MAVQDVANCWIEAFNRRDLTTISSLYAPDAELYDSGMRRARRGQREIESWFRLRFASMPDNVYVPEVYEVGDAEHMSVTWNFYGRSPKLLGQSWLSRPFQVRGTSSFTVRDGLIHKQHGLYEHLSVLRQIFPWLGWLPTLFLEAMYALYLLRHHQW
jgi:hypothetical protein